MFIYYYRVLRVYLIKIINILIRWTQRKPHKYLSPWSLSSEAMVMKELQLSTSKLKMNSPSKRKNTLLKKKRDLLKSIRTDSNKTRLSWESKSLLSRMPKESKRWRPWTPLLRKFTRKPSTRWSASKATIKLPTRNSLRISSCR